MHCWQNLHLAPVHHTCTILAPHLHHTCTRHWHSHSFGNKSPIISASPLSLFNSSPMFNLANLATHSKYNLAFSPNRLQLPKLFITEKVSRRTELVSKSTECICDIILLPKLAKLQEPIIWTWTPPRYLMQQLSLEYGPRLDEKWPGLFCTTSLKEEKHRARLITLGLDKLSKCKSKATFARFYSMFSVMLLNHLLKSRVIS